MGSILDVSLNYWLSVAILLTFILLDFVLSSAGVLDVLPAIRVRSEYLGVC